jgi:superfamily II DNA or RNA helicase
VNIADKIRSLTLDPEKAQFILDIQDSLGKECELIKLSHTALDQFYQGAIDRTKPFQLEIVEAFNSCKTPDFSLEAATGCGKTVIAGFCAEATTLRADGGRDVIFICASRDLLLQSIAIFSKIFSHQRGEIGGVNEWSKLKHFHFVTPSKLLSLKRDATQLYQQIVDRSCMAILDEAHNFPKDTENRLKVYGEVERIAQSEFVANSKRVLAMTAACWRSDRQMVLGKSTPDYRFTTQDANKAGICPNIHGLQVRMNIEYTGAKCEGEWFKLEMKKSQKERYWQTIAEVMAVVYEHTNHKPFCAFTMRCHEAYQIAKRFNKFTGLGDKGLVVLVGTVTHAKRQEVFRRIRNGDLVGYITVKVGVHGIDIPQLEVAHIIARSRSVQWLVQSVGRILRICDGKQRALVVDYGFATNNLLKGVVGLYELAEQWDSDLLKQHTKLPIITPLITPDCDSKMVDDFIGRFDLSNEKQLLIRGQPVRIEMDLEALKSAILYSLSAGDPIAAQKIKADHEHMTRLVDTNQVELV